jgi:hypothetical protein
MMTANAVSTRSDEALILLTDEEQGLYEIESPMVQAVIYIPRSLPHWFEELAEAVRKGEFRVPRTVIPRASRDEIDAWLENNLPTSTHTSTDLRSLVKTDILTLVDHVGMISGATRFMLRILTAAPNTECGFHVDTVPPGANPWGLLRVYTGAGTEFVDPANVTSMADFYRYLSRRERLTRERRVASDDGDKNSCELLQREMEQLDNERTFLRRPNDIQVAPAGSITVFKHLDVSLHWSNHAKSMAWIHSSPMAGDTRFLVNLSPDEPPHFRSRRGRGATAH